MTSHNTNPNHHYVKFEDDLDHSPSNNKIQSAAGHNFKPLEIEQSNNYHSNNQNSHGPQSKSNSGAHQNKGNPDHFESIPILGNEKKNAHQSNYDHNKKDHFDDAEVDHDLQLNPEDEKIWKDHYSRFDLERDHYFNLNPNQEKKAASIEEAWCFMYENTVTKAISVKESLKNPKYNEKISAQGNTQVPKDGKQNKKEKKKKGKNEELLSIIEENYKNSPLPLTCSMKDLALQRPGYALYFGFLKFSILTMLAVTLILSPFHIYKYSKGSSCITYNNLCFANDFWNKITYLNVMPQMDADVDDFVAVCILSVIISIFLYLQESNNMVYSVEFRQVDINEFSIAVKNIPTKFNSGVSIKECIHNWVASELLPSIGEDDVNKNKQRIKGISLLYDVKDYYECYDKLVEYIRLKTKKKLKQPETHYRTDELIFNAVTEMENTCKALMDAKEGKNPPEGYDLPNFLGTAIITFDEIEIAKKAYKKYKGLYFHKYPPKIEINGETFSNKLKIEKAKNPRNYRWYNISLDKGDRYLRYFGYLAGIVLIIILECVLLYFVESSPAFSEFHTCLFCILFGYVIRWSSLAVVPYLGRESNQEEEHLLSTTLRFGTFASIAFVPTLVKLILSSSSGSMRILQHSIILYSIFNPLFTILDIGHIIKLCKLAYLNNFGYKYTQLTQREFYKSYYKPQSFNFGYHAGVTIGLLYIGCYIAPIAPIACFACLASLFLNYWCEKYVLLRRCRESKTVSNSLVDGFDSKLKHGLLFFWLGLATLRAYNLSYLGVKGLLGTKDIILLIVIIIILFFPIKQIAENIRERLNLKEKFVPLDELLRTISQKKKQSSENTENFDALDGVLYEKWNPAESHLKIKLRRVQKIIDNIENDASDQQRNENSFLLKISNILQIIVQKNNVLILFLKSGEQKHIHNIMVILFCFCGGN